MAFLTTKLIWEEVISRELLIKVKFEIYLLKYKLDIEITLQISLIYIWKSFGIAFLINRNVYCLNNFFEGHHRFELHDCYSIFWLWNNDIND